MAAMLRQIVSGCTSKSCKVVPISSPSAAAGSCRLVTAAELSSDSSEVKNKPGRKKTKGGITLSHKVIKEMCQQFVERDMVLKAASEVGLKGSMLSKAIADFLHVASLKSAAKKYGWWDEMHEMLIEVRNGKHHIDDLFPYFMDWCRNLYPNIISIPSLERACDLSNPAEWYPLARSMKRRIVVHCGPTNSGKTHNALQKFMSASRGVYCAPLIMLATEMWLRTNEKGIECDLVTGQEKRYASGRPDQPASHVCCTVEMAGIAPDQPYDIAVIDEIQMLADDQRGGAWSRALLGLPAHEVHVCGEPGAVSLIKHMIGGIGENLEVVEYNRLSPLVPLNYSLDGSFEAVKPGDCIVAFSRNDVYQIREKIEAATKQPCALVYGALPPVMRNQQAEAFNSLALVKSLAATDCIGMGLNLEIKRMIFYQLVKRKRFGGEMLSSSQVKQIAGRAGRFGSTHSVGEVTTFFHHELATMHRLLKVKEPDHKRAGLLPLYDQIELLSYQMPRLNLHEIMKAYEASVKVNPHYFMCRTESQKEFAAMISLLTMSRRDAYVFSLTPTNHTKPLQAKSVFRFAELFSYDQPITIERLSEVIGWPHPLPITSPSQVATLEACIEVIGVYLWLSMRFPQHFTAGDEARLLKDEIMELINQFIISSSNVRKKMKLEISTE